MASFSKDWMTWHEANWRNWLQKFAGKADVRGLEIGSYEGRSALWFIENILTLPSARLTCIDPRFKPVFETNIAPVGNKVEMIRGKSEVALRDPALRPDSYHFVYIDGNHNAVNVLEDAVLTFRLLMPGGIMIFDDYSWQSTTPEVPQSMPLIAIDAFMTVFKNEVRVLHRRWQVALEKVTP